MTTANTIKMKVNEIEGHKLDWAVAKALGRDKEWMHDHKIGYMNSPSTDWAQGGPIIEREVISVGVPDVFNDGFCPDTGQKYFATLYSRKKGSSYQEYGPTPLIAAMRCFVLQQLGAEIEIPIELTVNAKSKPSKGPTP